MKREDILSRFLQANEHDPIYLRDVILNVIIAGKDTSATTLAWFIYLVCKHPDVQSKIVNELREVTKTDEVTNFAEFANSLNEEVLENLHYLHAAITETLRIYPAVPVVNKILNLERRKYEKFSMSLIFLVSSFYRMQKCVSLMILCQMDSL